MQSKRITSERWREYRFAAGYSYAQRRHAALAAAALWPVDPKLLTKDPDWHKGYDAFEATPPRKLER